MVTVAAMGRALLAAVALERAAELLVSRRNARRLLAAGAVEAGRGHYPAMVVFHAALLAACAIEPALRPVGWPWAVAVPAAALVIAAQVLRWWAVWSLGGRWSTRVLVLPGAAPVRSGPYRWLRHPNYLAVIAEVAALPLACGAWRTAVVATLLNAGILAVRLRAEEGAMGGAWEETFEGVGRFVPNPNPNLNPVVRTRLPPPGDRTRCRPGPTGSGHGSREPGAEKPVSVSGPVSGSGDAQ